MKLGPNQKAWIAALRSGKYDQTNCMLQDDCGHCCLGVACDLFVPPDERDAGRLIGSDLASYPNVTRTLGLQDSCGQPSGTTSEVEAIRGHVRDVEGCRSDKVQNVGLTALNDYHDLTFDQIADVLETFPERYFLESI